MNLTAREQDELRQDLDGWAERIAAARKRPTPRGPIEFDPVGVTEVAAMVGAPVGTVTAWRRREKMPEAHMLACGPIWNRADIKQWIKERRRAKR